MIDERALERRDGRSRPQHRPQSPEGLEGNEAGLTPGKAPVPGWPGIHFEARFRSRGKSICPGFLARSGALRPRTQAQVVYYLEDLFAAGAYAEILSQVHPAHRAGRINQELRRPGDVVPSRTCPGVQQVIAADDLSLRIRKEREGKTLFFRKRLIGFH